MLLNNWDRLPLIWENDGNPANLMLLRDPAGEEDPKKNGRAGQKRPDDPGGGGGGRLLAIDQAAAGLAANHREPYLERVRRLCRGLAKSAGGGAPSAAVQVLPPAAHL